MHTIVFRSAALAAASLAFASVGTTTVSARPTLKARHVPGGATPSTAYRFNERVFVRGSSRLYNPDALIVTKHYVFVDYQNASDTSNTASRIVKYNRSGVALGSVEVLGRCDGMRWNPYTRRIWALVNNDGLNGSPPRQPALYVIDPKSLHATLYRFGTRQPHGGGYDDLAFVGGRAFVSASSPTLNGSGVNDKPAVVELRLERGEADIRPILYGNAVGYNVSTGKTERLNITDPDSLAVDARNDLILISEGDAQVVTIRNPGVAAQQVFRVGTGTQLDETAFPASTHGTFYIADTTLDVVYAVEATFPNGSAFSEAALGAPVQSFVGALDPSTGTLTPLLTVRDGILDPTTLIFTSTETEYSDS